MPKDKLNIYVDRLKGGDSEDLHETLSPSFMEVEEPDLKFSDPVVVSGQAYLTKEHLVLHLKIKTKIIMPCAICNEMTETPLEIDDLYHTEELTDIKGAIYDCLPEIRSALLLKVPAFLECHGGRCPQRHTINSYLKTGDPHSYQPFKDL